MKKWLHTYRFELLLIALMLYIFDKIFFQEAYFYARFVWPFNMVLLGTVSIGIFHENKKSIIYIKNLLFVAVVTVPFTSSIIFGNSTLRLIALVVYLLFYIIIFNEVIRQVVRQKNVSESVIMGSLSGFLLLIVIAVFSFLILLHFDPNSFNNLSGHSVPESYQQLTYFSIITLTTIGYGDITPFTDSARLLAGFWGLVGQFYMIAVVGIIISKYTSKQ